MHGVLKPDLTLPQSGVTLEAHITDGGEAEIWRVRQHDFMHQTLVAKLVVVPWEHRNTHEAQQRRQRMFDQEATSWREVARCSHIVPCVGTITESPLTVDGAEYFVLGFLTHLADQGDLRKALSGGHLKFKGTKEMVLFLKSITEGLKYAHDKGVAHLDIKPENILLFSEGNELDPRLTDFGISISSDFSTDVLGTFEYMSPERFLRGHIPTMEEGKQSDIYALGCLFYEVVTAKHPFFDMGVGTMERGFDFCKQAHETKKPDLRAIEEKSNPEIARIIGMMLEKDAHLRRNLGIVLAMLDTAYQELFIEDIRRTETALILRKGAYRWNPEVHRMLGNSLHYYFIDCESQATDREWILNNLEQRKIYGFSLYTVLGEFDYLIRIWLKGTYLPLINEMWQQFEATCGGRVKKLDVRESRLFTPASALTVQNESELLATIANCSAQNDPEAEFKKLQEDKFVTSRFDQNPNPSIRFFAAVKAYQRMGDFKRKSLASVMETALRAQPVIPKAISVYSGEGDYVVLLKFRITDFGLYPAILESLLECAADARKDAINVSLETFVEVPRRSTIESDDGSIVHEASRFVRMNPRHEKK